MMMGEIESENLEIDAATIKRVFFPHALRRGEAVLKSGHRFVHYTSAEVATSILKNREVWMRNSTTMNDFMEVEYGLQCLKAAYKGSPGILFNSVLNSCFNGAGEELHDRFSAWLPGIKFETYLTCVSEHPDSENELGRLSMWRAYGGQTGVALVLNAAPFFDETDVLKAYSSPVGYFTQEEFDAHFLDVAKSLQANTDILRQLGRERVFNVLFDVLRFSVQCTKHPGFQEEREWRVIYVPSMHPSDKIIPSVECVRGTPQLIYKIPLKNYPNEGLLGLEIPELLERIIIGPSQHPHVLYQAFFKLLKDAGVQYPQDRIVVSDIPLR
jgi:hypothetical protein